MLNLGKLTVLGLLLASAPAMAAAKVPTRMSTATFKTYAEKTLAENGIKAKFDVFYAANRADTMHARGVLVMVSRKTQLAAAYRLLTGKSSNLRGTDIRFTRARGVNLQLVTRAGYKSIVEQE